MGARVHKLLLRLVEAGQRASQADVGQHLVQRGCCDKGLFRCYISSTCTIGQKKQAIATPSLPAVGDRRACNAFA
jgi:hypothetical protein